jgi:hypothetical protein
VKELKGRTLNVVRDAVLSRRGGDDVSCHAHRLPGVQWGRSAWFLGVLVIAVYLTFATTLYLLPPKL